MALIGCCMLFAMLSEASAIESPPPCTDDETCSSQASSMVQRTSVSQKVESTQKELEHIQSGPYVEDDPVVYYEAKYVLPENAEADGYTPPMVVATSRRRGNTDESGGNMDPKLDELGLDFTGIWWMSDNPVPEELVSFANTRVEATNGGFPATLHVPNTKLGMWSWTTSNAGTVLRKYYATSDPEANTGFIFDSTTEGHIETGLTHVPGVWVESFKFYKYTQNCHETSGSQVACDPHDCAPKNKSITSDTCQELIAKYPDDMWSRPTKFQDRSLFDDATYTLKRIVYEDGSPHPVFWQEFLQHMTDVHEECKYGWWGCETITGKPGEKKMQSYMSDDWCARKHAAAWLYGIASCR